MNEQEIVRELRNVQEKHKNDFVSTFAINISEMARDCADCIESLSAQLAESQRRERAAVKDFTSAAHSGNILCEFCGAECIDAGCDTGGDTYQCGTFTWRGSQEAGEGETE